jgi:hypothetical protein
MYEHASVARVHVKAGVMNMCCMRSICGRIRVQVCVRVRACVTRVLAEPHMLNAVMRFGVLVMKTGVKNMLRLLVGTARGDGDQGADERNNSGAPEHDVLAFHGRLLGPPTPLLVSHQTALRQARSISGW